MSKEVMDSILRDYQDQLFYLGNAYATQIPLPMWFKHFGTGEKGAGEAYHLGIFGKTGSGKSVLAKMILCARAQPREYSWKPIVHTLPPSEVLNDLRAQVI
jgi:hypothetical protein